MVKHGVKVKPRNYRRESGETREMLRVLTRQRTHLLDELINTEVIERFDELDMQLAECESNILEAKRILKEELRKGV